MECGYEIGETEHEDVFEEMARGFVAVATANAVVAVTAGAAFVAADGETAHMPEVAVMARVVAAAAVFVAEHVAGHEATEHGVAPEVMERSILVVVKAVVVEARQVWR